MDAPCTATVGIVALKVVAEYNAVFVARRLVDRWGVGRFFRNQHGGRNPRRFNASLMAKAAIAAPPVLSE